MSSTQHDNTANLTFRDTPSPEKQPTPEEHMQLRANLPQYKPQLQNLLQNTLQSSLGSKLNNHSHKMHQWREESRKELRNNPRQAIAIRKENIIADTRQYNHLLNLARGMRPTPISQRGMNRMYAKANQLLNEISRNPQAYRTFLRSMDQSQQLQQQKQLDLNNPSNLVNNANPNDLNNLYLSTIAYNILWQNNNEIFDIKEDNELMDEIIQEEHLEEDNAEHSHEITEAHAALKEDHPQANMAAHRGAVLASAHSTKAGQHAEEHFAKAMHHEHHFLRELLSSHHSPTPSPE